MELKTLNTLSHFRVMKVKKLNTRIKLHVEE